MNLNIGNSVRRGINILGMQLDKYMQSLKIWQPTFLLTGKIILIKFIFIRRPLMYTTLSFRCYQLVNCLIFQAHTS